MAPNKVVPTNPKVDALILTALEDELEGLLTVAEDGPDSWDELSDDKGFRYFQRLFDNGRGGRLKVAAAWTGQMGARTAAARARQLIGELDPFCLAMCGICAGDRKKVALGDVIVADRLYFYDEGKIIAPEAGAPQQYHDIRTFDLSADWRMDAAYFRREIDHERFPQKRPISKVVQQRWLLSTLLAHKDEGGSPAHQHAERQAKCPNWTDIVQQACELKLVELRDGQLRLTDAGRDLALNDRILHPDGLPEDPQFKVHVGAIGTGSSVQEDPKLFDRLRRIVRTTLGVEMEGAAIAEVAEQFKRRMLVIKSVSDFADLDKDDNFRAFACSASAGVLVAFLLKHLEPAAVSAPATIENQYGLEANGGIGQNQEGEATPLALTIHQARLQTPSDYLCELLRSFEEVRPYITQSRWSRISSTAPKVLVEQWTRIVEKLHGYQGHVVDPLCVAMWREACSLNLVPPIRALDRRVDMTWLAQEYFDRRKWWGCVDARNLTSIGPRVRAARANFRWQSGPWSDHHTLAGPLFELVWDVLKGQNPNGITAHTAVSWWTSAGGTVESVPATIFPWPVTNRSLFTADEYMAERWNEQYAEAESYYLHIPDDERIADNLAMWQVDYQHEIWHGPHVRYDDWKALAAHMSESPKSSSWRAEFSEWAHAVPLFAAPESGLSINAATAILEGTKFSDDARKQVHALRLRRARFCAPDSDPERVIASIDAEFAEHPWVKQFGRL